MDATDLGILEALRQNGRASAAAIGKRVGLSLPAVRERMKKLELAGVIQGYTVRIGRSAMGLSLLAFVLVRLAGSADTEGFRVAAANFPCVVECHHLAGAYDYLLKVALEETHALERFLTDQLKRAPRVAETNTMIVLATLKEAPHA